jgi:RsiW-degrading membrane proteinase PrsW (M82 family)
VAALVSTVNRPGETRLSAAMLGDFYTTRREPARALEAFLVETERSGWRPAWKRATMLALSLEDRVALKRIGSSAGGLEALKSLSTTQQAQVAGLLDDYGQVLKIMALHVWQLAVNHRLSTFVTLVAGLIWYILLHNVAGLSLLRWKSIVAVALGVLSPVLTLFFLHLQEDLNKFQLTGDPVNDLVYYVAGVALREEVSKLLLFCPLLFFLRRSQLVEILTVSACVGLGFAIEENIGYFGSTPSGVVWARFMTANFLHCALTGLAGLALFQLLFGSTHAWHEHLLTILAMIAAHGVYNYLLGDYGGHPTFQNNGLSIVVLIAVSWRYFVLVRLHRQPSYQHIGPLFLFLCGLSLLFSVSLACTSWQIGLDYAFQFLSIGVLSTVVLAIFYCQRVHDL